MKVFISTSSFGKYDPLPITLLENAGMEIQLNPYGRKLTEEECWQMYRDVDGLIAGTEPLTALVLHSAPRLKVISRCGVGMDNVDCETAKELGIDVLNTPSGPTEAAAELTVGLLISLLRFIPQSDREVKDGKWHKRMGGLVQGRTVGIIGMGRIGCRVAELLLGFGANICYYDPMVEETSVCATRVSMGQLLSQSDVITIHAAGKGPLLGREELKQMKPTAVLINCSRGGMIDEDALYEHLKHGDLAGAALDVFQNEPYSGRLIDLENVVLTPHIGSYAREARVEMEIQAVNNLLSAIGRT